MNVLLELIIATAMQHAPIQRDHLLALVRLDMLEVDCSAQVKPSAIFVAKTHVPVFGFFSQKIWEWDVLVEEILQVWGLIFATNSGNGQVWDN